MTKWLRSLSPRDSRLLAIAVAAVLLWVFYGVFAGPLFSVQTALSDELENARKTLGRIEEVVARARESKATGSTSSQQQAIWEGSSVSVIAANVQKQVQSLAQSNGITIVSISQTQSRFSEDIQTAGLVIEGHGEIASFVSLFTELERQQPMLFIDKLMLRRFQSPGTQAPGSRLPLAARFEVRAPHRLGKADG